MITQKRLIVPIFNYKLSIVIFDDWEEVKHLDYEETRSYPPAGFTQWSYGSALVVIDAKRGSTIVHEAEHVKNLIWEYIGYRPQIDNDEVDAYLLTYIYNKITDVFYKHNGQSK
jgi:hypothetical protein